MKTPWGESQTEEQLAPGITYYTTASHGGIRIDRKRLAEMPAFLKPASFGEYGQEWFEEDCESALVMLAFRHLPCFAARLKDTVRIVREYYPVAFRKWRDSLPRTCPTCRGSVAVRLNYNPDEPGVCGDAFHGLGTFWARGRCEGCGEFSDDCNCSPCIGCGKKGLPLHADHRCPDCHPENSGE